MKTETSNLRGVKVTYSNGAEISTSLAAHLTDEEILKYFAIGKVFNLGSTFLAEDNLQIVSKVEILN